MLALEWRRERAGANVSPNSGAVGALGLIIERLLGGENVGRRRGGGGGGGGGRRGRGRRHHEIWVELRDLEGEWGRG